LGGKVRAHGGNLTVEQKNIGQSIKIICRIYDPTAGKKQRIHRAEDSDDGLTWQA
jgi:hypothetical protein